MDVTKAEDTFTYHDFKPLPPLYAKMYEKVWKYHLPLPYIIKRQKFSEKCLTYFMDDP